MDFDLDTIALGIRGRDETGTVIAGPVVVRGERIEIAGRSVVTAEDRLVESVADTVAIGVFKTISGTVVFGLGIDARPVLDSHGGVVVARCGVGASRATAEVTGAIVVGGGSIVIAGRGIGASAATGVLTGPVVERSRHGRVAGRRVGTTRRLDLVAQAIVVGVVETAPIAIQIVRSIQVFRIEAGDGEGGIRVIVARPLLEAARTGFEFTVVVRVAEVARERQFTTRTGHRTGTTTVDAAVHEEFGNGRVIVVGGGIAAARGEVTHLRTEDRRGRVVVAGDGNHAARAGQVFAGSIVEVGTGREVAGPVVGTSAIQARTIVVGRLGLVVDGHRVGTSTEFTGTIVGQRRRGIVVRRGIRTADAGLPFTAAVVLGGRRVVVARGRRRTAGHLEGIAHPVPIVVLQAVAEAVVFGCRIGAGTVVGIGLRIEVAGVGIHTARIEAGPVIGRGVVVKVVGGRVRATAIGAAAVVHVGAGREVVRRSIRAPEIFAIAAGQRGRRIVVVGRRVGTSGAGLVVTDHTAIGGIRVVIARTGHEASGHLIGIAHPVSIGILEAVAVAVHAGRGRVGTAAIVGVGVAVEVAGGVIRTSEVGTGAIVRVGRRIEVRGRGVQASEVDAVRIRIGLGVVVVRLRVRTSCEDTGAVVRIGVRVVVVRSRIHATEIDAIGVHIGLGIVVVGLGVGTTAERAAAVVDIGTGIVVVRSRVGAAQVLAEVAVRDEGPGVVIVRLGIVTARTGQVFAGTVVIRGTGVVAGEPIGAARHLEGVADAITVGVGQAVPIAVILVRLVEVHGVQTAAVVGQREGVVVARRLVGTSEEFTGAIVEGGVRVVVRRVGVRTTGHHTGTIVDGRQRIVVAGIGIRAAGEDAGAVVVGGIRVVVLSTGNRATEDDTGTVVEVGLGVVVLGVGVRTTEVDAGSIVGVGRGVIIEGCRVGTAAELTGTVVLGGGSVVVVRSGIRTASSHTGTVIVNGRGVIVVRRRIRATTGRTGITRHISRGEAARHAQVVGTVAVDKDLVVEQAGHLACRRELTEQHRQVIAGNAVGIDVGDEPGTAGRIVHEDLSPTVESDDPILTGALGTLDGPFSGTGVRCALDADGHPRVKREVRE